MNSLWSSVANLPTGHAASDQEFELSKQTNSAFISELFGVSINNIQLRRRNGFGIRLERMLGCQQTEASYLFEVSQDGFFYFTKEITRLAEPAFYLAKGRLSTKYFVDLIASKISTFANECARLQFLSIRRVFRYQHLNFWGGDNRNDHCWQQGTVFQAERSVDKKCSSSIIIEFWSAFFRTDQNKCERGSGIILMLQLNLSSIDLASREPVLKRGAILFQINLWFRGSNSPSRRSTGPQNLAA